MMSDEQGLSERLADDLDRSNGSSTKGTILAAKGVPQEHILQFARHWRDRSDTRLVGHA
jgi:hypothetical protein